MLAQINYLRKRTWVVFILATTALVGWFQVSGYQTIHDLRQVWEQEAELEAEAEELRQRNAEIEREIEELAPGGPAIERKAREDLGWSKKDEVVIRVPNKK